MLAPSQHPPIHKTDSHNQNRFHRTELSLRAAPLTEPLVAPKRKRKLLGGFP